jgi:hypothetical protein
MQRLLSIMAGMVVWINLPAIAQSPLAVYTDPIDRVVAAGLMQRDATGDFREADGITRAEMAVILARTFDLEQRIPLREPMSFTDVPADHWAYDEIQLAVRNNIMTGYTEGRFHPSQPMSRTEGMSILAQAQGVLQLPEENIDVILARYPDANEIPLWARRAMATALYQGFVNLTPAGEIRPLDPITRGDMAYALNMYLVRQMEPAPIPPEIQYPR